MSAAAADTTAGTGTVRASRWIPWTFVLGFLLVFVVNGALIWFAVSSFSGVAVEGPFDRGRAYNDVLAEAKRQATLGWTVAVSLEGRRLTVTVTGADGAPIDGLAVVGVMVRPVERVDDVPVTPTGAGNGRYVATVELPKPGIWDAKLLLTGRRDVDRLEAKARVRAP